MKTAVCIVLTLVLVSLPQQVLAQRSPNVSSTADVLSRPGEGSQAVPTAASPIPTATLLWQPIANNRADVVEEPFLHPAPVSGWSDWSTEKRAWVIGGVVVGLMVLGLLSIG